MPKETEHKYLVADAHYKELARLKIDITQGYLSRDPQRTVRIRIAGDNAFITVKGINIADTREEFEYPIPPADARQMLSLCIPPLVEKIRWIVPYEGYVWEVDEYKNALEPLVVAEVELPHSIDDYPLPPFVGKNVTGDPRYYNSNLGLGEIPPTGN